jgi:hypothetical protein
VIDIRIGSKHPLAWQGGDYLAELRAAYRARPGAFADLAAIPDLLVLGCKVTLPVWADVFRKLGCEVDDSDQPQKEICP